MLEEYYDDNHWESYVKLCESFWVDSEYQKRLLNSLNGDIELAKVIYGIFEEDRIKWIEKIIPSLGNIKPINCIDEILSKRLKTMLTRMPK